MPSVDLIKAAAVADFAASVYRGTDADALLVVEGRSREEAVLEMAAECASPLRKRGILAPALRARLDAMDKDYADILTRIDEMAMSAGRTKVAQDICITAYN